MNEPEPPRETWDEDTYEHLRLTRQGFAAVVTLNRPDLHNAFNERFIGEIQRAFERLSEAEDIRAVVLQGAGKSFCAGADLNWMRASLDFTHDENIADALKLSDMLRAIDAYRHPVIGRIHGAALGGGAGLVAVCDLAIAAEALLRRLTKKGEVPSVNTLVGIGNLVSIRSALPTTLFDLRATAGTITVRFASGDERYTTLNEAGEAQPMHPEPGEVIFSDEMELVIARRWC